MQKKALTVGLAALSFAVPLSLVTAGPRDPAPVTAADVLPAYEIVTRLRAMALEPTAEPVRRGPYFDVRAVDARGVPLRVIADAEAGQVLAVTPLQPPAYAMRPDSGPRIIHVPDPGEERADLDSGDDDWPDENAPPAWQRAAKPRPSLPAHASHRQAAIKRSAVKPAPHRRPFENTASAPAALAPLERRAILTAPPPPPDGPSPIYPTPRFGPPPADHAVAPLPRAAEELPPASPADSLSKPAAPLE